MYRYYKFVRFEGERVLYKSENLPLGVNWDLSVHKNVLGDYHKQQNLPFPPSNNVVQLRAALEEVLKYRRGDSPYDYSHQADVDESMAEDWTKIEELIVEALK